MTSEYTPTEDEWREATTYSLCDWWRWFESEGERDLAWARFIARVKAGAWDEGAQAGATALGRMMRGGEYVEPANPYREEASDGPVRRG